MINKIKLSSVTTYKFGGYCENFVVISEKNIDSISEETNNSKIFVLGKGSNTVFSDDGYEGLVIKPDFNEITLDSKTSQVNVGSSVYLPTLSRFYKNENLINAEYLIGIPGSVGGATRMNAGAHGWEFSDLIVNLKTYNLVNNTFETIEREDIKFDYRSSSNLENRVVISATLKAIEGDPEDIKRKMKECISYRKKTQPPAMYNAGSVFKNSSEYSAGELIDRAGLKGYNIDGVSVSKKHANFFIASKNSNANSLYRLVNYVKEVIDTKYGVSLETEILFVGNFN